MTDFWDKIAGVYDLAESINGDVYHEMCAQTERLVPAGAKVLDCAAGTGELSLAAAKNAEFVVCTDLSEKMLKNARRKAGFFGADNISFETRNIFDLKDPDNTYDIVIAGNVLHLLKNPQGAVMELYRVLKPGGKLLLPTFTAKNRITENKDELAIYRKAPREASYKALQGDRLRPGGELFPFGIQENARGLRHWQGLHKAHQGNYPVLLCSHNQEQSRE